MLSCPFPNDGSILAVAMGDVGPNKPKAVHAQAENHPLTPDGFACFGVCSA